MYVRMYVLSGQCMYLCMCYYIYKNVCLFVCYVMSIVCMYVFMYYPVCVDMQRLICHQKGNLTLDLCI